MLVSCGQFAEIPPRATRARKLLQLHRQRSPFHPLWCRTYRSTIPTILPSVGPQRCSSISRDRGPPPETWHQRQILRHSSPLRGLTPTKQRRRRDRTRRRRDADLKRPARRQWRDISWRRLFRWCCGRLVRRRRSASQRGWGSDPGRLQDRFCGDRRWLARRRRDASSDPGRLQDRLCGDRRRLVRRRGAFQRVRGSDHGGLRGQRCGGWISR